MANIYCKDNLIISAGTVYDNNREPGRLVAHAEGGKVVKFFENEAPLTDFEKTTIEAFVSEADAAPNDRLNNDPEPEPHKTTSVPEAEYTHIGPCEMCGEESNQSWGSEHGFVRGHVICTTCCEVLEEELLALEDDEPAGKAYIRARRRCKLMARIRKLKAEKYALEDKINELQKELKSELGK